MVLIGPFLLFANNCIKKRLPNPFLHMEKGWLAEWLITMFLSFHLHKLREYDNNGLRQISFVCIVLNKIIKSFL